MAVSGVHSSHTPSCPLGFTPNAACGSAAGFLGTVNSRSIGFVAPAAVLVPRSLGLFSSSRFRADSFHSMFDWPEHTHTSPTATFLNALPLTASVTPVVVALSGTARMTAQLPLASATVPVLTTGLPA